MGNVVRNGSARQTAHTYLVELYGRAGWGSGFLISGLVRE